MFVNIEVFVSAVVGLTVVILGSYGALLCLIVGESLKKRNFILKLHNKVAALEERLNELLSSTAEPEWRENISPISLQSSGVSQSPEDIFCPEFPVCVHVAGCKNARATSAAPGKASMFTNGKTFERPQSEHDYEDIDDLLISDNVAYLKHMRNTSQLT